jgi:hypothetical protein
VRGGRQIDVREGLCRMKRMGIKVEEEEDVYQLITNAALEDPER